MTVAELRDYLDNLPPTTTRLPVKIWDCKSDKAVELHPEYLELNNTELLIYK